MIESSGGRETERQVVTSKKRRERKRLAQGHGMYMNVMMIVIVYDATHTQVANISKYPYILYPRSR
jgi:hypothetical protein